MNIYIDESGSFVSAKSRGSWNAVVAYAVPEVSRKGLEQAIRKVRATTMVGAKEVKLNEIDERTYFSFLVQLGKLNGVLFCTATDAGLNTSANVVAHQASQVAKILEHIDKMKFEGGRQAVETTADMVGNLSPQLYVQLFCQIELMYDVVSRATNYFAQRLPRTLAEFRWRVDQKDIAQKTEFEQVFERLCPSLLQTISLSDPFMKVIGFDYSSMKQYEYAPGQMPTYLKDTYGYAMGDGALNIGKIVRGNMDFVDSKDSVGVQAADLIASGVRRCLRQSFQDNERAANLLGSLMLQAEQNKPPLRLTCFDVHEKLPSDTSWLVREMIRNARPMLKSG